MELLRDVGQLYRKLTTNSRTTQSIETTLKLSANVGKLSKNLNRSAVVKYLDACRCMVSREPRTKIHEIREM